MSKGINNLLHQIVVPSDGKWHSVFYTRKRPDEFGRLYLDGGSPVAIGYERMIYAPRPERRQHGRI